MLGRPITHSLSPALHRAAYVALGLDWTYDAIDCGETELPVVLAARRDWAGFSCTMPLKRAALDVASQVRPLARAVGAANTLLPSQTGWVADNTDVAGILGALAEHDVSDRAVTILGAGGTAQATVAALPMLGVLQCTVLVRDPLRAIAVRDTAARVQVAVTVDLLCASSPALDGAGLVVSTLPAGAADPLVQRHWSPGIVVLDAVYEAWPTRLARAVSAAGGIMISGALMLLHQAGSQVELMTGATAPVQEMRAALREASPDCGL